MNENFRKLIEFFDNSEIKENDFYAIDIYPDMIKLQGYKSPLMLQKLIVNGFAFVPDETSDFDHYQKGLFKVVLT